MITVLQLCKNFFFLHLFISIKRNHFLLYQKNTLVLLKMYTNTGYWIGLDCLRKPYKTMIWLHLWGFLTNPLTSPCQQAQLCTNLLFWEHKEFWTLKKYKKFSVSSVNKDFVIISYTSKYLKDPNYIFFYLLNFANLNSSNSFCLKKH